MCFRRGNPLGCIYFACLFSAPGARCLGELCCQEHQWPQLLASCQEPRGRCTDGQFEERYQMGITHLNLTLCPSWQLLLQRIMTKCGEHLCLRRHNTLKSSTFCDSPEASANLSFMSFLEIRNTLEDILMIFASNQSHKNSKSIQCIFLFCYDF